MPVIAIAAIAVAVSGTAYNVYQGQQAASQAKKAQKKADAAANALAQLSTEQWDNYKENYKPVVTDYVEQATKPVNQQEMANSTNVDVIQGSTGDVVGIPTMAQAGGFGASSTRAKDALYGASDQVALGGAAASLGARDQADDIQFNRRMGAASTGRGIPGDVMAGYGQLADRFQNQADKWSAKAQGNYQAAGQFAANGIGAAGSMGGRK